MLLGKSIIPRQRVVERPVETSRLVTVHSIVILCLPVWMLRRLIIAIVIILETRCRIESISDTQRQCNFGCQNIVEHCKSTFQFQILAIKVVVIALPKCLLTHRMGSQFAFAIVWSRERTVIKHLAFPITSDITICTILEIDVGTNHKPRRNLCIQFQIGTHRAIIITTHNALIVHITQREIIVGLAYRTSHAHIIILIDPRTERLVFPVESITCDEVVQGSITCGQAQTAAPNFPITYRSILGSHRSPRIQGQAISSKVLGSRLLIVAGGLAFLVSLIIACGRISAISFAAIEILTILDVAISVIDISDVSYGRQAPIGREIDSRLAVTPSLGGNQHHAIGSFGSVNSCRRSILQNINLLYIIRINLRKLAIKLHSVKDYQWRIMVATGINRTLTTQGHRPTTLGIIAEAHVQTCRTTKHILNCGRRLIRQFIRAHLGHTTSEVFFLHGSIAHHNYFFQGF